jgi:hypothetical protein
MADNEHERHGVPVQEKLQHYYLLRLCIIAPLFTAVFSLPPTHSETKTNGTTTNVSPTTTYRHVCPNSQRKTDKNNFCVKSIASPTVNDSGINNLPWAQLFNHFNLGTIDKLCNTETTTDNPRITVNLDTTNNPGTMDNTDTKGEFGTTNDLGSHYTIDNLTQLCV